MGGIHFEPLVESSLGRRTLFHRMVNFDIRLYSKEIPIMDTHGFSVGQVVELTDSGAVWPPFGPGTCVTITGITVDKHPSSHYRLYSVKMPDGKIREFFADEIKSTSKDTPMILNLYKIHFMPGPSPSGFAFILAVDAEMAKESWLADLSQKYVDQYGLTVTKEALAKRNVEWKKRWHHTELIPGPFKNGYVICNVTGDY